MRFSIDAWTKLNKTLQNIICSASHSINAEWEAFLEQQIKIDKTKYDNLYSSSCTELLIFLNSFFTVYTVTAWVQKMC